ASAGAAATWSGQIGGVPLGWPHQPSLRQTRARPLVTSASRAGRPVVTLGATCGTDVTIVASPVRLVVTFPARHQGADRPAGWCGSRRRRPGPSLESGPGPSEGHGTLSVPSVREDEHAGTLGFRSGGGRRARPDGPRTDAVS